MNETGKRAFIIVGVALVAFLAGFGWQYLRAQGLASRLEIVEREAAFAWLGVTLAATTIEAQRGSYEGARQLASNFFGGLQSSIEQATPESRPVLDEILAQRDATITALSRSSPQSGTLLARMLTRYRLVLGEPVGPTVEPEDTVTPADTGIAVPPDTATVTPPRDTATDTLITTTMGR